MAGRFCCGQHQLPLVVRNSFLHRFYTAALSENTFDPVTATCDAQCLVASGSDVYGPISQTGFASLIESDQVELKSVALASVHIFSGTSVVAKKKYSCGGLVHRKLLLSSWHRASRNKLLKETLPEGVWRHQQLWQYSCQGGARLPWK